MDKVQKPSNFECYTASSEPFRMYLEERCLMHTETKDRIYTTYTTSGTGMLIHCGEQYNQFDVDLRHRLMEEDFHGEGRVL
jgi:hypothetical protein